MSLNLHDGEKLAADRHPDCQPIAMKGTELVLLRALPVSLVVQTRRRERARRPLTAVITFSD